MLCIRFISTHIHIHSHTPTILLQKYSIIDPLRKRLASARQCGKRQFEESSYIVRWPLERVSEATDTSPSANNVRWRSIVRAIIKFLPRRPVSLLASIYAPRKSIKIIEHADRKRRNTAGNSLTFRIHYFCRIFISFYRVIPSGLHNTECFNICVRALLMDSMNRNMKRISHNYGER